MRMPSETTVSQHTSINILNAHKSVIEIAKEKPDNGTFRSNMDRQTVPMLSLPLDYRLIRTLTADQQKLHILDRKIVIGAAGINSGCHLDNPIINTVDLCLLNSRANVVKNR